MGAERLQAAPAPPSLVPAKGSHFESVGRIRLHAGQPCTPQIMFDFRGKSVLWLAAPKRETAVLTDAARHNRKVRVSGVWRRGAHPGCAFVEVTRVVVEQRFLGIF
jgi:hypothetical protein